ncbi:MAG: CpsB/CapC family capsule biosynthesis tyrosine phosphatase, partial [Gemmatimonadota bacterium]
LHCHLLPAVDDGSRSVEQSVAVLQEMVRHGVVAVCLTPHLLASQLNRAMPRSYDRAYNDLVAAAPSVPALHRGLEVMLDGPLEQAVAAERRGTLGGSRYILVEFHRMVSRAAVIRALGDVLAIGLVPVVAHPERYSSCSPESVKVWRGMGARMQVDATTLLSSRSRGRRARELVTHGLADIIAADNHGDGRLISTAAHLLAARGGGEQADLLSRHNPERILNDGDLLPVPPLPLVDSWWRRIRSVFEQKRG